MDINNLKNIVGEAKQGEVAVIKFFGRVTEETTSQFNSEFEFLENCVRPSLIRILINSGGRFCLTRYDHLLDYFQFQDTDRMYNRGDRRQHGFGYLGGR